MLAQMQPPAVPLREASRLLTVRHGGKQAFNRRYVISTRTGLKPCVYHFLISSFHCVRALARHPDARLHLPNRQAVDAHHNDIAAFEGASI